MAGLREVLHFLGGFWGDAPGAAEGGDGRVDGRRGAHFSFWPSVSAVGGPLLAMGLEQWYGFEKGGFVVALGRRLQQGWFRPFGCTDLEDDGLGQKLEASKPKTCRHDGRGRDLANFRGGSDPLGWKTMAWQKREAKQCQELEFGFRPPGCVEAGWLRLLPRDERSCALPGRPSLTPDRRAGRDPLTGESVSWGACRCQVFPFVGAVAQHGLLVASTGYESTVDRRNPFRSS